MAQIKLNVLTLLVFCICCCCGRGNGGGEACVFETEFQRSCGDSIIYKLPEKTIEQIEKLLNKGRPFCYCVWRSNNDKSPILLGIYFRKLQFPYKRCKIIVAENK